MTYAKHPEGLAADQTIINLETPPERQKILSLTDDEVITLARWCKTIEKHYGRAMDIEWAKDGINQQLYIVQARPETVHGKEKKQVQEIFTLSEKGTLLTKGIALGDKIVSGTARIIGKPQDG